MQSKLTSIKSNLLKKKIRQFHQNLLLKKNMGVDLQPIDQAVNNSLIIQKATVA